MFNATLYELWYATLGAINYDEINERTGKGDTTIKNVDRKNLHKIVHLAGKAVGVSDEASERVKAELQGLSIGDDDASASDDWKLVIYGLSHAVSFRGGEDSITSVQYRDLVRQMIIYLKVYVDTGRVSDEVQVSTVPMTFGQAIWAMLKLCMQVPFRFLFALIPRTIYQVMMVFTLPKAGGKFAEEIFARDSAKAAKAFWVMIFVCESSALPWELIRCARIADECPYSVPFLPRRFQSRLAIHGEYRGEPVQHRDGGLLLPQDARGDAAGWDGVLGDSQAGQIGRCLLESANVRSSFVRAIFECVAFPL